MSLPLKQQATGVAEARMQKTSLKTSGVAIALRRTAAPVDASRLRALKAPLTCELRGCASSWVLIVTCLLQRNSAFLSDQTMSVRQAVPVDANANDDEFMTPYTADGVET